MCQLRCKQSQYVVQGHTLVGSIIKGQGSKHIDGIHLAVTQLEAA